MNVWWNCKARLRGNTVEYVRASLIGGGAVHALEPPSEPRVTLTMISAPNVNTRPSDREPGGVAHMATDHRPFGQNDVAEVNPLTGTNFYKINDLAL